MTVISQLLVNAPDGLAVQLFRYLIVGGAAFAIDFGSLFVLARYGGLHYLAAAAIAFLLGLAANYALSVRWVFSRRRVGNAAAEFLLFAAIGVIGLGLNELGIYLLVEKALLHYMTAKAGTAVMVLGWNFAARKAALFR